ncbi:MAG TPA: hypothetical protein PKW15_02275 [Alphaproteobacteria bacterium]|nr:hypothetical protein [Alphaproteobacteria bacterium]
MAICKGIVGFQQFGPVFALFSLMDSVTASQTAQIPQFRGTSRAQMDFAAMEARQRAINPQQADQDFGFADFIDMINPLQHIPIVSSIYREITGDQISPAMKIAGGGIFGGPLGAIGSMLGAIYEQANGEEIESTVAGWFDGEKSPAKPATDENIQLADIRWNNTKAVGFGMAAATPLPEVKPEVITQQVATAEPAKPTALFESLNKGVMPTSYSPPPTVPSYFKPNAAQFQGIQPATLKTPTEAAPPNDTTGAPQSDFARKMMEALDRYQASKNAGGQPAPAINQGL